MYRFRLPSLTATLALAAVAVLALAVGLMSQGTAQADHGGEHQVPTSANISSTSMAPVIECKWELPNYSVEADTLNATTLTVGDLLYDDDDDPLVDATAFCSGSDAIQVYPNFNDDPGTRKIGYFAAVEDEEGIDDIADVYVKVFHPDGSEKYQLHMTQLVCPQVGDELSAAHYLFEAKETGQMDDAEAKLIIEKCGKNTKAVYGVVGDLSKDQPCGVYTVEVTAVDSTGATGKMTNKFEVFCTTMLAIDFCAVNFGSISPNSPKWIAGDHNFAPTCDTLPTITNWGNADMYLMLNFSDMKGAVETKIIHWFDAQLETTNNAGVLQTEAIDPVEASTWVTFCVGTGSNDTGQLDLSIHPEKATNSLPADDYSGTLDLAGTIVQLCNNSG